MPKSNRGKSFDFANQVLMAAFMFVTLYPFWYIIIHSLNDPADSIRGGLWLWPRSFTWRNFAVMWGNQDVPRAFLISVARTSIGTLGGVLCSSAFAYVLTRRGLPGRRLMSGLVVFTMFFSGGLIPYYVLIRDLGLINKFPVYIIPTLYGAFNIIIARTYFQTNIPAALEESARIDGCNDLQVFFRVVLPLSKPILATIALFVAVWHWNDWFAGYLFITRNDLIPFQTLLVRIVNQAQATSMASATASAAWADKANATAFSAESIRTAAMVSSVLPIMLIYPFLQKYFVKGVVIGAVKE